FSGWSGRVRLFEIAKEKLCMYWERSAPRLAQTREAELGMLNGTCSMVESKEAPNIHHSKFNI
ncbi:MAG TPA: hypothetical protein VF205_05670, partial [Nitrospiraceae bacterium]